MANDSPLFKDKQGSVNDHVDWLKPQVKTFTKADEAAPPCLNRIVAPGFGGRRRRGYFNANA